jgi:hypothetical protein
LLQDRPQLLTIVAEGDPLWNWLNAHFTNTNGLAVVWSDNEPDAPPHYVSQHGYDEDGKAVIYVKRLGSDGQPLPAEQLLSAIVFELSNASHKKAFFKLAVDARNGKLSRKQFIDNMAEIEFSAKLQVKQFAVDVWIPYAVSKHLPFQNPYWSKGVPEDFDQWLYDVRLSASGYPDDIYGPYYDKLTHDGRRAGGS